MCAKLIKIERGLTSAEHVSGVENRGEQAKNRVERSGAVSERCRKRWSGSGARSGEQVKSGAYSRYKLSFH